jgi:hypothetical protein
MDFVRSKALFETKNFLPNYGYVPFRFFQQIYIVVIILSFVFKDYLYEKVYKKIYAKIDKVVKNKDVRGFTKSMVALLPVLPVFYYDFFYRSFSMKNVFNISSVKYNRYLNTFLRLMGSYVIIQVAAQDLGVKTGTTQSDFTKISFMQVLLYVGCAFAITQDRSEAFMAGLLYFQLKYFGSEKVKDVCFD